MSAASPQSSAERRRLAREARDAFPAMGDYATELRVLEQL